MAEARTITSTGIAKLAGVGRAAVSNWRRRYADFPQPVGGTATSPAFELVAVEKWLSSQGKLPAASGPEKIWRELEAASGGPDLGEALWLAGVGLLAAGRDVHSPDELLAAVRAVDPPAAEMLGAALPDSWSRRQRAVLAAVAADGAGLDPAVAFEDLFSSYVAARGSASDYTTPPGVARLMLSLAGPADSVLDAACGSGTLLMAAMAAGGVECFGQDIDPTAARIAQVRLLFGGLSRSGSATVRVGDSLRSDAFPGRRVDLVVSNPPFGLHDWADEQLAYDPRWEFGGLPPRTEPELAWVQDALAHLEPGGLAVLLMPPGAAWRSAGRRIRAELLRRGALRAIIGLPPRLLPATSIGLHLWVLRRSEATESGSHVLLVDTASVAGDGPPDVSQVTKVATDAWRTFDRDPAKFEERAGVCGSVPVIDLLDEDVDVSPARHLTVAHPDLDPSSLLAARDDLARTVSALPGALPALGSDGGAALAGARRVSLDDLARSGGVQLTRWPMRAGADNESQPAVTGADILGGTGPSGRGQRDGVRVEAGDVLVPTIGRTVVARVATAEQVGAQLGQNVYAVRPDRRVLDPWYLAGMLSAPVNLREATRGSTGTGVVRINVRRLQVPLLPLEDQARYGDAFRRLAEFDRMVAQASDLGRQVARSLSDALSSGTLAPGPGD